MLAPSTRVPRLIRRGPIPGKLLLLLLLLCPLVGWGQAVNISAGTTVTEPLTIGTSPTAALPAGWKVSKSATERLVTAYASAAGNTELAGSANISSTAGNGIYNFGNSATTTDRAVGGLSSSTASKSVNLMVQLTNNGTASINDFTISYNVEKYRNGSNAAGFSIRMFYSTDGTAWTAAGTDFVTSFTADANNNGVTPAPGTTVAVTNKALAQSLAAGSSLYLAWNYSVTTGSTTSNAQALGVDDISITATAGTPAPSITLSSTALNTFTTTEGTASASQSYTVAGSSLTADISVVPPAGYELALETTPGSNTPGTFSAYTAAAPLVLTRTGGTVGSTRIYARLAATTTVAGSPYDGSITHTSGTATGSKAVTGTVTAANTPTPTSFTPAAGPVGTVITIAGTNLSTITSVTIGGTAATFGSASATAVTATVAAGNTTGAVVLSNGTTYTVPGGSFTVTAAPTVTTTTASAVTATTATSGGAYTTNNATITERGVVYGSSPSPQIGGSGVVKLAVTGTASPFTASLVSLTPSTTYYVAAYVISEFGTTYGADQTFTTPGVPFEDFETTSPTKTSYTTGTVTTAAGPWIFDEAAVGALAGDVKNGSQAARLRGGSIYMNFNKPNGAGTITVNAARYGTDAGSSYAIDVSNDDGATFTAYNGPTVAATSTLTPTTFTVNVSGNIRLRVRHVGGTVGSNPRLNIDDIFITNYASPITAPTFTGTAFCAGGAAFDVKFTPTGTFTGANEFQVQLSSATGSFAAPTLVGTLVSTTSGAELTASVTIPAGTANGTGYRLRVVSTSPALTGDNSVALTVVNSPTVSVTPAGDQSILTNTNGATLTANETPAAASRQWVYAATPGGATTVIGSATNATYMPNFATAGDYYVKVISTFAACGSATSNEVKITVTAPVVTLTATTTPATAPTEISGLSTTVGTPSANKTFVLSGSNLGTTPVTVTAPAGFQVSTTAAFTGITADANTVSVTPASGSLNRTIYVRLTGSAVGSFSGTIAITNGTQSAPVLVSGTVNPVTTAALTVGSLNNAAFTTIVGVASTPARFYTLTGTDLTTDVTVTAPAGFEVSATSATAGFAATLTLTPTQVVAPGITIYVRLSGAAVGTPNSSNILLTSGNITHTSSPATTQSLAVDGNIVPEPVANSTISASGVSFNAATLALGTFGDGYSTLFVVRPSSSPAVAPTDQTTYTGSSTYGATGTGATTGADNYVVQVGGTSVTVTGLSAGTTYTVDAYEFNEATPVSGVSFENYKPLPGSASFTTTAAPLVNYDFTGGTVTPSFAAANVSGTGFVRGSSLVANTAAVSNGTYASSGYTTSASFSDVDYVGFSVAPAAGYQFTLTSLSYADIIGSSTGPAKVEVRYSLSADFSSPVSLGTAYTPGLTLTTRTLALSGAAFQNQQGPVYFRVYGYDAGGSSGVYRIDNVNVFGSVQLAPLVAEINVTNPAGTDIASNGTYNFGPVQPGATATATFTIQNLGNTNLTLSGTPAVQFEAGGSSEFTITAQPTATTLAGAASTTFTVTYTPVATAVQTATLTIASNDADENLYRIVLSGAVVQPYVWNGSGTNWNTPSSWTPSRDVVDATDVLVFDGSLTPMATVTSNFSSPQTVAQLTFQNGVVASFTNTGARTLNITNGSSTGADFTIGAGSALTVTGSSTSAGLVFQLGTGATARVAGSLTFNQGPNRLQSSTAGSIEFVSGSSYLSGPDQVGSPFGSATANANSVIFRNGSRAEQANNSQLFGITAPTSAIVLEPSSLFVYSYAVSGAVPPLSNRTFGNLEFSVGDGTNTASTSGGTLTIAGNLLISSGNVGLNLTNTISVAGNILINGTSTLTFNPSSTELLSLNGTTVQTIGGTAPASALVFGPGSNLQLNNAAGVVLARPLTLSRLQMTAGTLTTDATNLLTLRAGATMSGGSGTSYVSGPLARAAADGASTLSFPIGKDGQYRPATLNVTAQTGTATYVAELFNASARSSTLQAPLTRVSGIRYVNITPLGGTPADFRGTVTLSFDADDEVTDPALSTLVVAKRSLRTDPWASISRSTSTGAASGGAFVAGTLTSDEFTSFSDFALASTDPLVGANPLPVELTSFTAVRQATGVLVKWTTASEKNSARFEVQRSADGKQFGTVATVEGQGHSTQAHAYASLDRQPLAGTAYYRLRQVDFDGKATFSPVVAVGGTAEVSLYPNPAQRELHLVLPAAGAHYRVLSLTGAVVLQGTAFASTTTLDVTSLPAGLYQLEVTSAAGRTTRKFIKQD